jgi:HD-GYP domain-containing protein (c-di-GMP phosphodiesterase class II)
MKKKTDVRDLRIGMYVAELDRPWRETPFLFQGFEIGSDEELAQLRKLCSHVYVETDHIPAAAKAGRSHPPLEPAAASAAAEPLRARPAALSLDILKKFDAGQRHTPLYVDEASLEQELPQARAVAAETRELVFQITEDVKLGRALDTPRAKKAVAGMVESVIRNPDALVWLTQLKKKDEYTAMHSLRVCILALAFGRHLDFTAEELNILGIGALLHDIGKLKVPVDILNKPARLTDQEFEIMKSHVPIGVQLLEATPGIPANAIEVARGHHERYDGHGYVMGMQGDAIGLFGSIGAIVDCYDALTSDRVYHDGMSAYDTLSMLYAARRKDFHPQLVEQFIQCMGIYPIGSVVELNTGAVAVVITVNRRRRLRPQVALVLNPEKKPYTPSKIVDLMHAEGQDLEIRKVLPAGVYGINPTTYLSLSA